MILPGLVPQYAQCSYGCAVRGASPIIFERVAVNTPVHAIELRATSRASMGLRSARRDALFPFMPTPKQTKPKPSHPLAKRHTIKFSVQDLETEFYVYIFAISLQVVSHERVIADGVVIDLPGNIIK